MRASRSCVIGAALYASVLPYSFMVLSPFIRSIRRKIAINLYPRDHASSLRSPLEQKSFGLVLSQKLLPAFHDVTQFTVHPLLHHVLLHSEVQRISIIVRKLRH